MMRKLYSLVKVICILTFSSRSESVDVLDPLKLSTDTDVIGSQVKETIRNKLKKYGKV